MRQVDDWKPEVGMEVYLAPLNGYRATPRTGEITKVGNRYFYVGAGFRQERFFLDSKHHDGQYQIYHCYRSEADYNRVMELMEKRNDIARYAHKLTDEQVDQVYEWITTNTP